MENKIKVVALFGKSASGKDTLKKYLVSTHPEIANIIGCTTRDKRDYEIDGVDYYFITNEIFGQKVLDGTMVEASSFRGWFYGTPLESLDPDKINLGVFNIDGLNCLASDPRIELYPILVYADDKTRLLRSLNREQFPDCHEVCRRFFADEEDFNEDRYEFEYIIYNNNDDANIEKLEELLAMIAQSEKSIIKKI